MVGGVGWVQGTGTHIYPNTYIIMPAPYASAPRLEYSSCHLALTCASLVQPTRYHNLIKLCTLYLDGVTTGGHTPPLRTPLSLTIVLCYNPHCLARSNALL